MLYVGLPVLSLIYIISFIIFYYSKKRINLFENKYVIVMMVVNVVGILFELGCYIVLGIFKNQDTFIGMFILKTYIIYILVFNWLLNTDFVKAYFEQRGLFVTAVNGHFVTLNAAFDYLAACLCVANHKAHAVYFAVYQAQALLPVFPCQTLVILRQL